MKKIFTNYSKNGWKHKSERSPTNSDIKNLCSYLLAKYKNFKNRKIIFIFYTDSNYVKLKT